jgi:carbon monoxide dehydrogenase subunit G
MDMVGERLVSAPRKAVWDALNDPETLKACIPGCETLAATGPDEMTATVAVKLGPISAKFSGRVKLSDIDPPNGYTLSGEGKGGPAGFAKGAAKVRLTDHPEGTMLAYTVEAQVGGKMAQLGSRLIDTTAKAMADQFFARFAERMQSVTPGAQQTAATDEAQSQTAGGINQLWLLAAVSVAAAVAGWLLLR